MNSDGGLLVIGVSDDRKIVGLSNDFKTLGGQKNKDCFENHLYNLMSNKFVKNILTLVKISFVSLGDKIIGLVQVSPSNEPIFIKNETSFYVRFGNGTRPLSMPEALDYIKEHWK